VLLSSDFFDALLLQQNELNVEEPGPQPADIFGEGKMFVIYCCAITCCCTWQPNIFLKM